MNETTTDTTQHERTASEAEAHAAAVAWLEDEFPTWTIHVDQTSTWEGDLKPLWIARSPGHHPQSELTAAKLHTRLADYEHREARRQAMRN